MSDKATVELKQEQDFRFTVDFGGGLPPLHTDERPPTGEGNGPDPEQLLATAVANCLLASLLFALRKFKQDPGTLSARAEASTGRNEAGRLRIQRIDVRISLGKPASQLQHLDRILSQFEDFCTVTQSVNRGIPVHLLVLDGDGTVIKRSE